MIHLVPEQEKALITHIQLEKETIKICPVLGSQTYSYDHFPASPAASQCLSRIERSAIEAVPWMSG